MAAALGPQPDFEQMAQATTTLIDNFSRCRNLPAVEGSTAILASLQRIEEGMERMEQRMDNIERGILASQTNTLARVHNSQISAHDIALMPLRNPSTNAPINNFPPTPASITNLSIALLNDLLGELGESTDGNAAAKRQRLRYAIGLKQIPV